MAAVFDLTVVWPDLDMTLSVKSCVVIYKKLVVFALIIGHFDGVILCIV